MTGALLKELSLRADYLQGETVETIYFGGGTPSLLEETELNDLLKAVHTLHSVQPGAEITLEANPDDITESKLAGWKSAGVNRLSLGIQSFFEEDLQWMNRAHSAEEAMESLEMALQYFENITADLIYGTPDLTHEKWKNNVDTLVRLQVPHLSCYALTVEPKTPLEKKIRLHQLADVDPSKQSEQFLLLMQWMEEAGYEHYEISNFAKPGLRSRHNSSYWQGRQYLGIGPSAHSFNQTSRQWNISNNQQYMESILAGTIPAEQEELTRTQRLNEYIMTSLRTLEGMQESVLKAVFDMDKQEMRERASRYLSSGLLQFTGSAFVLTREGKLLADGIAADLFY